QPVPAPASLPDDPKSEEGTSAAGSLARDCGDFDSACASGYTFFRRSTGPRSTADQTDASHEWIYIVYDATKPGTEVPTGTTYGSIRVGTGSQSGIYFVRYNGSTGTATAPALIDNQAAGHQLFPDISADGGYLHAIWWDSRNDPTYSPARPIGNDAAGHTVASLDVYRAQSTSAGTTWTNKSRVTALASNPNYEQFSNRTVPFAGDYLWVSSIGAIAFTTWTDWRDTVAGTDPREPASSDGADVTQCRTYDAARKIWSGDQCPHAGGLDQNIYGAPLL
ncbi:MAG TPA: hypothetical protein VMZ52_07160, partial [Bryobacteraceae bacterium]|nr:hypothetical protein [Bryobacteraceae bacterium]